MLLFAQEQCRAYGWDPLSKLYLELNSETSSIRNPKVILYDLDVKLHKSAQEGSWAAFRWLVDDWGIDIHATTKHSTGISFLCLYRDDQVDLVQTILREGLVLDPRERLAYMNSPLDGMAFAMQVLEKWDGNTTKLASFCSKSTGSKSSSVSDREHEKMRNRFSEYQRHVYAPAWRRSETYRDRGGSLRILRWLLSETDLPVPSLLSVVDWNRFDVLKAIIATTELDVSACVPAEQWLIQDQDVTLLPWIANQVHIRGLTSAEGKPLNGQRAELLVFNDNKKRFRLELETGEEKSIKPCNIHIDCTTGSFLCGLCAAMGRVHFLNDLLEFQVVPSSVLNVRCVLAYMAIARALKLSLEQPVLARKLTNRYHAPPS